MKENAKENEYNLRVYAKPKVEPVFAVYSLVAEGKLIDGKVEFYSQQSLINEAMEKLKEKYIELMEENIDNPAIFALNDHKFHLEIIRATENLLLSKFMDIVSSALLKVQNITSRFPSSKIAIPQHKEILDAIIHKDIIRAQGILAQHINTTEKKLIEYFNLREGNSILT